MTERSFAAGVPIETQIARLLDKLYPPDEAAAYLETPAPFLRGEIPARVIAAGQGQRVLDHLRALADGAFL